MTLSNSLLVPQYLLDTNIAIYIMNQRPLAILEKFRRHENDLCISIITLAELAYGAEYSQNPAKTARKLEAFVSGLQVIDYAQQAAQHYGNIKAALRRAGNLISDNDMHIAAHARSLGIILVTNNVGEFQRVDGLRVENWVG